MRGGTYQVDMLPTTCHIYFGDVMIASPNGRLAHKPVSEGISPEKGADVSGPTAVIKSCAKMDHLKTGGTLLTGEAYPGCGSNRCTRPPGRSDRGTPPDFSGRPAGSPGPPR